MVVRGIYAFAKGSVFYLSDVEQAARITKLLYDAKYRSLFCSLIIITPFL
jgi:hypothetical protein